MSVCIADFFGLSLPDFLYSFIWHGAQLHTGKHSASTALKQLSLSGPALEYKRKYMPTHGIAIKLIIGVMPSKQTPSLGNGHGFRDSLYSLVIDF